MLRLWVCIWASRITPEETGSSPVTQLCSSPALPSLQPLFSPAGRGCPSTWTGPSLLPRSEPWMLDTWRGWSDCRRGRSDVLQPGDKTICYGPLKQKKKSQFWHWMHNTVWGPSAPNTFFITLAQWIDRFWYNIIGPCVGVKNKTSTHHFSNQGCQVWSHLAHLRPQILLQLQPVGSQRHDTTRKPLDVNQVNGRYIHTWRPNNQRMISIIFLAGAAFVTFKPVHGMKREIVSPDRIRSEDACLHYRFMRELLYPPVLDTKDTCSPEWAKKGHNVEYVDEPESSWHKLTLDMDEINFDPSGMCICEIMQHILWMCGVLTHRGAWCIQDGLSLGTVHHHLL